MTPERMGAVGRLLAVSLARLDNPRAELAADEVARFVALLEDVAVRDSFLRRLVGTEDPTWRLLVTQLARKTPPGHDREVCCALGLRTYLDGDGVLACAALDRALANGPHTLALTLRWMLERGCTQAPSSKSFRTARSPAGANIGEQSDGPARCRD